ncbi:MAG: sulfatase, partial [Lentisphaerae bacterium]|nr:sulfatase [Lentisphaerota bacterium]
PTTGKAAVSTPRTPSRPHILFCIADDASFPHMSAYGCPWVKTPGFDRVAAEGLLFRNAYTPNAKCAPSRACILTGRNSWQLEAAANHWCYFPEKFKTYAEALREHGYFTGYTQKGWAPGVAEGRELTGTAYSEITLDPPTTGICATDYAANFAAFLDDRPADRPFCFWYGGIEPHRGYEYGSGIRKGGKQLSDIDRVFAFWPDNETVRTDMLDYAYEIEWFDLHLQRMLDTLEQRGLLDDTLVIVTSDNGMPFPRIKGQEYEYSNHMPLAAMWRRGIRNPGRTIEDYVSFIDFAPTFLELAGLTAETAGMEPVTGRALTDLFQAGGAGRVSPERDRVLIGRERHDVGRPDDAGYPIRGLFRDGWLYLRNFEPDRWPSGPPQTGYPDVDAGPTKTEVLNSRVDPEQPDTYWNVTCGKRGPEELYHVAADRDCLHNLADDPAQQARREAMRDELMTALTAQGDPRVFGHGACFDAYPYAQEKVRFYYNRLMAGEPVETGWLGGTDREPDFPAR